jgi:hypothetical protein
MGRGWSSLHLGLLALGLAGHAAHATAFCEILPSSDGFVALRQKPDAQSHVLRRLLAGDDVQLDTTRRPVRNWQPVLYWGAERRMPVPGWIKNRLISKECG